MVRRQCPAQRLGRGLLRHPHRFGQLHRRISRGRTARPRRQPGLAEGVGEGGLSGRSWPADYGGEGAPAWQDDVVAEVKAGYGVSTKVLAVGLEMLPPVLFVHGSHEQRLRYLPPVLRGEETWCQLLSEPDAGSDLGSAKSFAAPVTGGWTVSGQKVWTSGAGTSDFALLIARSDRETSGMAGLSCFLMSMRQPGVEVRPFRQMSGAYHFNEVFLQDVFVPEESLIGQLGDARAILRTMLASERAAIGGGTSARGRTAAHATGQTPRASRGATGAPGGGRCLHQGEGARSHAATDRLRRCGPGRWSVAKLMYSEHARLSADTGTWLLGPAATAEVSSDAQPWRERLLFAPGLRIGGGTDEIQRNTIAERGLSLPR